MNENEKISIFIGTPAYNGMVHIDYLNTILDCHKEQLPITVMNIGNESLITRGRNTIISYFNALPDFSHLLFLDADIGISGADIRKLIISGKDVIGAAVPMKGRDSNGNNIYNITEVINANVDDSLMEVKHVGTAVLMLSKKAVKSLILNALQNNDIYQRNMNTTGASKDVTMYDVFKTQIDNGQYLSEDFYVCKKLRELGYNIYVDKTIITKHNGMVGF